MSLTTAILLLALSGLITFFLCDYLHAVFGAPTDYKNGAAKPAYIFKALYRKNYQKEEAQWKTTMDEELDKLLGR